MEQKTGNRALAISVKIENDTPDFIPFFTMRWERKWSINTVSERLPWQSSGEDSAVSTAGSTGLIPVPGTTIPQAVQCGQTKQTNKIWKNKKQKALYQKKSQNNFTCNAYCQKLYCVPHPDALLQIIKDMAAVGKRERKEECSLFYSDVIMF